MEVAVKPTVEQLKKLLDWLGFKYLGDGRWLYPDSVIHWQAPPTKITIDELGFLFQWAVSKLWKAEKVKDLLDEGFITRVVQYPVVKLLPILKGYGSVDYTWNCFLTLVYKPYLDSDKEERKEIHTTDSDPAPALFWAIDKVREGEG